MLHHIEALCALPTEGLQVTVAQVRKSVKALNPGKVADESGISAEHLKKAQTPLLLPLRNILQNIISRGQVPKEN